MMEGIEFKDVSLIGRIKTILQETTEKQSNHDFSIDMALRAQHTAELYQIIDGISKDKSKLEVLKTKQRLRERIQEMENDIKAQVSQLLTEEAMEKSYKTIEKVQKKHSLKPSPLKISQGAHHSNEIHSKLSPRARVQSSPLCQKCDNQHNMAKSQNLECWPYSLLPCLYPSKQYVLPLHSCSCLQNAYFYPLAQPSRIRKQETTVKTHASFTSSNKDSRFLTTEKIYFERGEPAIQNEKLLRNVNTNLTEKNMKKQLYNRTFQCNANMHEEKSGTRIKERQTLFPEPSQIPRIIESKKAQKSELEKKYKNKCIQTDKHTTSRSTRRKPNEKYREQNHKKVLRKQSFPNCARNSHSQNIAKTNSLIDVPASLDNVRHKNESVLESHNRMNDYLSNSIKQLQTRAQIALIHNLQYMDKSTEFSEMDVPTQTLGNSHVLNRLVSNSPRNEEDNAALPSALYSLQDTINTQNLENHSNSGANIDKDLLEKLIVDVIYEDLQGLYVQPVEDIIHNESNNTEVISAETEDQKILDMKQHSEQEESELPPSTEVKNVVTPELSPQNSLPSSSSSSPPSSPCLKPKPLPATPSLSEQESTSDEILQQSQPVKSKKIIHPVATPDLTPPQSCSPKHYVDAPPLSPQPTNVSESESHDKGIKKSVKDASIQVSKVSSSGESTLGTIATSISDTTDEFLSDGELLLKHFGHSLSAQLDRGQKKSNVTIQNHPAEKLTFQISKSSLSEGELPLLKAERSAFSMEHHFQTIDSSIDESHFPVPTTSTFEQIWEDISEGQIIPQYMRRNIKPLHLDQASVRNSTCYHRQLSNTLSEGEISALHAEATPFKTSNDSKQDYLSHYIPSKIHISNNNLSVSSGEIEDDEKLNKSLVADGEENLPGATDAEFFDEDKETVKVLD